MELVAAFALAALILYATASTLPLATAAKFGESRSAYLGSGVLELWRGGNPLLALLVAAFGFVLPVAHAGLLALLAVRAGQGGPQPGLRGPFRWAARLNHWAMAEVQLLGIAVAFTKLSALAETRPAAGLACFAAAGVCSVLATKFFDPAEAAAPLFPVEEANRE